jgi:hypothetical protein
MMEWSDCIRILENFKLTGQIPRVNHSWNRLKLILALELIEVPFEIVGEKFLHIRRDYEVHQDVDGIKINLRDHHLLIYDKESSKPLPSCSEVIQRLTVPESNGSMQIGIDIMNQFLTLARSIDDGSVPNDDDIEKLKELIKANDIFFMIPVFLHLRQIVKISTFQGISEELDKVILLCYKTPMKSARKVE